MRQERLLQIIQSTRVTEKSSRVAQSNQLVFVVDKTANKEEIKAAVEALLEVKVIAVNTVLTKGKKKRFGARLGRRQDVKKAYVSLDKSVDMEALLSEQA